MAALSEEATAAPPAKHTNSATADVGRGTGSREAAAAARERRERKERTCSAPMHSGKIASRLVHG